MPNTVIIPDSKQLTLIAWPYRKDNRNVKSAPWKMGKMTPAGGVYSNIKDLSNLLLAQMKAYQAKVVDTFGVRYGHGGELDGYASDYVFMPHQGLGIILLTSSGGRWFGELGKEIRVYIIKNRKSYQ